MPRPTAQPACQKLEPRLLFAHHHAAAAVAVTLPRPDHLVIVFEENKDFRDVLGAGPIPASLGSVIPISPFEQAGYLQKLAKYSANFINAHGELHPSQPNYLEFFSGSAQGVDGDSVPSGQFSAPSLGGELIAAGFSFAGYSEGLPAAGSLAVTSGEYARKHNPASDFKDVPASSNLPFSDFPVDFSKLPTVSIVVPNQVHDMHSANIESGDKWFKSHLGAYAKWMMTHNSMLIVTWDEGRTKNHIPTIMTGPLIKPGKYNERINHLNMLSMIETMYGLAPLGGAAGAAHPISDVFTTTASAVSSAVAPVATPPRKKRESIWLKLSAASGDIPLGPFKT